MDLLYALTINPFLATGITAWMLAQVAKAIIYAIVNKNFDIKRLFGDGGMPSSHSATVTSLAVITGLVKGFGSFEFAAAFILAAIVCHDATGVRREAGRHAVLLNEIIKSFDIISSKKFPKTNLNEFIGHTPVQVVVGMLIGVADAVLMYNVLM